MEGAMSHYVENNGVKIHYVSKGEGPLVVFIHGWPDFWYSWKGQIEALSSRYRCVALDTRGYNLSDKPEDAEALAQHIERVLSSPALLPRLACAGQQTVLEQFTLERMADEIEMWLTSIVP